MKIYKVINIDIVYLYIEILNMKTKRKDKSFDNTRSENEKNTKKPN